MFRIERRRRPIYPTIKKTPQISFRGSISAGLSRFRYQKIDRLLGGQYAPVYPAAYSIVLSWRFFFLPFYHPGYFILYVKLKYNIFFRSLIFKGVDCEWAF